MTQNDEAAEKDEGQTVPDTVKPAELPKTDSKAPESQPQPGFQFNNSALDFMLNDDMEEAEEAFSSSEEDSE